MANLICGVPHVFLAPLYFQLSGHFKDVTMPFVYFYSIAPPSRVTLFMDSPPIIMQFPFRHIKFLKVNLEKEENP